MCMKCRIFNAIFDDGRSASPIEAIVALREVEAELQGALPAEVWEKLDKDAVEILKAKAEQVLASSH